MKSLTSNEIRQKFLNYFHEQGHEIVSASSLVPGNDPTLLFTNAGMVQFKDVFLGFDHRPYSRATTSQKCMRISGKHNDLENVGPSPRHHTFFEMLGNFSFGDYFKHEAIKFAFEILTKVYGLPENRLAFTVYTTDNEAFDIWTKEIGINPNRVARMGEKTNFWQMAETGPCGPTTEIHWDKTPELGEENIISALEREDDRFLELWNLVFMQFNRTQADPDNSGKFDEPLPATGVDTGMGLERIVAVLQGVDANYDTDLFMDIMDETQKILGHSDRFRNDNYVAYRVIADHTRAATFLIADGVNPGTTGREYICRMLIRRAWRFAHNMGVEAPFLVDVADAVVKKMGPIYPELIQFKEAVHYQISTEEERFIRTLDNALSELENRVESLKVKGEKTLSGVEAFSMYATHGLPLEITRDLLQESGMDVDEQGFQDAMNEHRLASGEIRDDFADVSVYQDIASSIIKTDLLIEDRVINDPYSYDDLSQEVEIIGIINDGKILKIATEGEIVELIFPSTPFYVESGGQVSDKGRYTSKQSDGSILEARRPIGGLITHITEIEHGEVKVGDTITISVDMDNRWDVMRNHTATHLLHAALREVLGAHVTQKGSLVGPDFLRFDFAHNSKLSDEELLNISELVNQLVLENREVQIAFKPLEVAKREGAMALFGEKYSSEVRTITIDSIGSDHHSYELCGGTHVYRTGDIGPFIILKEESSAAGVRRIIALTGMRAQQEHSERQAILDRVSKTLMVDQAGIEMKVDSLLLELETAQKIISESEQSQAGDIVEALLSESTRINEAICLTAVVDVDDTELLGWMADRSRERIESGVVVLGANVEGKARLVAKVSKDLIGKGIKAGDLIKQIAGYVKGGGGGRPDFATAGGKDPSGLEKAIEEATRIIKEKLT